MTIDYIGQELIWKLRGIHPYEPNNPHYCIRIICCTPEQNKEIKQFILSHIPYDSIAEINMTKSPFITGDDNIVSEIKVKNVFGNISILKIVNQEWNYDR